MWRGGCEKLKEYVFTLFVFDTTWKSLMHRFLLPLWEERVVPCRFIFMREWNRWYKGDGVSKFTVKLKNFGPSMMTSSTYKIKSACSSSRVDFTCLLLFCSSRSLTNQHKKYRFYGSLLIFFVSYFNLGFYKFNRVHENLLSVTK